MRLSPNQIAAIHTAVHSIIPNVVAIRLFGSRLNDEIQGGDIDLMVDVKDAVEHPAQLSARLAVRISRAVGGRKVDVILCAPNLAQTAIHKIASERGILI